LNIDCVFIILAFDPLIECLDGTGLEGKLDILSISDVIFKSILGIVVRSPFVLIILDSGEDYFLDNVEFITIYDSSLLVF